MVAKVMKVYTRSPQPENLQDPKTIYLYVDQQLKHLQNVLADMNVAIKQLQVFTGVT